MNFLKNRVMEWVIKTDIGLFRKQNQDRAIFCHDNDENVSFALVCDGMGGHFGGAVASQAAVDVAHDFFAKKLPTIEDVDQWVSECLELTRTKMEELAKSDSRLLDMGTTWVAALIFNDQVKIYNIGDSRCYIFGKILQQVSIDHNLMNHYINNLNYSPQDAAKVPNAHALIGALGPTKKFKGQKFQIDLKENKIKHLILTSDGIHDYIDKIAFEGIFNNRMNLENKALYSIQKALEGGSRDNLTILIIGIK